MKDLKRFILDFPMYWVVFVVVVVVVVISLSVMIFKDDKASIYTIWTNYQVIN